MQEFIEMFRDMWLTENKVFGLEVQEHRLGGLCYRMEVCERRLKAYLKGTTNKIDELEEVSLAKVKGTEGEAVCYNNWAGIITNCLM